MKRRYSDYLSSYASPGVHALMLRDASRVEAYNKAFKSAPNLLRNKVVIDVGAGTGILSLLAAEQGAKIVYAVEGSHELIPTLKDILIANWDCGGKKVHIIPKAVEDLQISDFVHDATQGEVFSGADVIISEWMGFCLLNESMLHSVIHARNNWLKNTGVMFPDIANIYASLVKLPDFWKDNFEWQENYMGFSFSALSSRLHNELSKAPIIMEVKEEQVNFCDCSKICQINLKDVKIEELDVIVNEVQMSIVADSKVHGFAFWFDVEFPTEKSAMIECGEISQSNMSVSEQYDKHEADRCVLSTSPSAPLTHWKQSVVLLPTEMEVFAKMKLILRVQLIHDKMSGRKYTLDIEIIDAIMLAVTPTL